MPNAATRPAPQRLVLIALAPMVAVTLTLALTSDHLKRPVAAGLYLSYLTAATIGVGLVWWTRRPASRFGPLLVVYGALLWLVSWQGSDWPLMFDIGVLAEAPMWLVSIYVFLAFPTGRIEPRAARWLMWGLGVGALFTFLPWALFSPVIAGGGPLVRCAPNCPPNVLQLGSDATVAEVAGKAETYIALTLTAGVFAVYLMRLLRSSKPQRRSLLAVAVTSLLFLPAWFVANFSAWILKLDLDTLEAMAWVIVGTRILIPLGFLVALLQAEHFAGRALRILLERLAARPSPDQWRASVAEALDDPALQLAYSEPATGRFREPSGHALTPAALAPRRAWVPVDRDDVPVAAMVIDETLMEDPELVRAAASATLLAVENGALEGELRASRARIVEAEHAERRRMERDLHDGAQQRLVALRMHLGLVGEKLAHRQEQELLDSLGVEVDQAIHELRELAHGVYPQLLAQAGVGAALTAVARRSGMPTRVVEHGLSRHPEAVEITVYFCCVECLQNAAKHAGDEASVTVTLGESDHGIEFCVEDDGIGFDSASVQRGSGLTNLADRVAAVGGTLRVDSSPGHGTRVVGRVPVARKIVPSG
ncbi:MAG TPA: ATP-binding protein [Solirubrobacteraceae bacterium]|nr:ATP-binding protein [Solirubrobacteraceae bacterium]